MFILLAQDMPHLRDCPRLGFCHLAAFEACCFCEGCTIGVSGYMLVKGAVLAGFMSKGGEIQGGTIGVRQGYARQGGGSNGVKGAIR